MSAMQKKYNEFIKKDVEEKLIRYFLNGRNPEGFKFWINLIDELLVLISFACDEQSNRIWGGWRADLFELRERRIEKGMRKVEATGTDGNPLAGHYGKFPIIACLTADPKVEINDAYKSICLLIVQKIFSEDGADGLNNFCELLRRSKDISRKMYNAITRLPVYKGKLNIYKELLNKTVDNYLEDEGDSERSSFLRSLFNLAEVKVESKRISHDRNISKDIKEVVGDDITIDIRQRVNDCQDGDAVPDNVAYVSDKDVEKEDKKHRPLDRLLAETEKSRYWLRGIQKLSRFDSSCLTTIEKARLIEFLRSGLASNDNELIAASMVIGIGYLTPIEVDEVISVFDSVEQTIITMDGVFICKTKRVTGRFKVGEENKGTCLNLVSTIKFELNEELATALSSLKSKKGKTIFEKLEVDLTMIIDRVDKELDILRNKDQYNITKRRINYALSADLMLTERNTVASLHINGNANNAMPVLAYYGVMSEARLCNIYRNSANSLMRVA